ncbi:MAG TPA: alpha/beta hydrolase fold domain-containing protein [Isosphaeraceae bacterium]|nr:alpha/beta hydrolase fold domain-containing protein [Isosphaeraceae bacterium]
MNMTKWLGWMTCAVVLVLAGEVGDVAAQDRPKDVPPGAKPIRDLEYARVGDVKLLLDLYLPTEGDGPFPVLVAIHGGGWVAGRKEEAQGIRQASRGYAVAAISYRLSGVATFPAQIEDCKAAVRWLRANAKKYNLDPERVGATGHSAGGHLASMLGTAGNVKEFEKGDHLEFSSQVRAVCALSGPTDFLQMDAHAPKDARLKHDVRGSPESRLIGGPIQENKEKVAKANPITYVSKESPAFLLIHGDQDPLVPVHQAQLLHDALKEKGVPVLLQIVKGAGHGVGGREVNDAIDRFFDTHLKKATEKGAAPAKDSNQSRPGADAPRSAKGSGVSPPGLFVCRGPNPTPEKEVDFPFIDGWLVRARWDRVEPKEGEYDWSYFSGIDTLADIGGGNRSVITAIVKQYSKMQGILFDMPAVVERAMANIEEAAMADRCRAEAGNFFEAVFLGPMPT